MINSKPPVEDTTRADRRHRSAAARKKRRSVKEVISQKVQNVYNKARRARKAKL